MPETDLPFDVSERERDLMARVVYGEANRANPRGQAAVGHVIVNRVLADGFPGSLEGVLKQPHQFEPWMSRRAELLNLPVNSRAYREARQTVNDVLAGNVPDMTGGATHFYAPVAQAQLGRRAPKWAQGEPLANEGGHLFYAPNGKAQRTPVIAPAEPATPTSFEETGILPLGASATPKAATMPKPAAAAAPDAGDDDLLALYGAGVPATTPKAKAKSAKPATALTATAPAPVAAPAAAPAPASADPASLDDDALLGLYTAPGTPKTAETGKPSATAPKPAASPVAAPEGIRDGNTGELVVGGKPFTDNSAGLWGGFQNLANGALLGAGVPLAAGAAALKEKLTNGGDLGNLYTQARAAYGGAQEGYKAANPGTALATELAGSIPTTIAATAAGGALLGAGGNALLDAVNGSRIAAPLAKAGQFVTGAAGKAVPAAAGVPAQAGNLLMRVGSQGTAGMAAGAFGGAINTSLTGGGVAENALMGAGAGAAVGAALPAAGAVIRSTFNKLTGSVSPEAAALARTAQEYGIPVRAAEISNSSLVRGADAALSKIPGMGYGSIEPAKQAALNRAIAGQMGETADKITPAVMQSAKSRIGQTFDKVAKDTWVRADDEFAGALQKTFADAAEALPPTELKLLQNQAKAIFSKVDPKTGEMEGSAYQALTSKSSPLGRLQGSDNSSVRHYANQIRNALDDALERSAAPELVDELRQARRQYRTMKTIEPLVEDLGGNIDASKFRNAVAKGTSSMAYGGGGDLADLARVAQQFGPAKAAEQAAAGGGRFATVRNVAQIGAPFASAVAGVNLAPYAAQAALPAAAGTAAAFAGGRVASTVLRSPALSNRLIDQALGTGSAGPFNRLVAMTSNAAPGAVGGSYGRLTAANDDKANRLMEFIANRPRSTGGML